MMTSDPLHILLTNDDGHEAPGIQALGRYLKQAGHRVSMVAPSDEQSSTGMSVTSRRNLAIQQLGEGSCPGCPAPPARG
jgi:5'-nucleotidase